MTSTSAAVLLLVAILVVVSSVPLAHRLWLRWHDTRRGRFAYVTRKFVTGNELDFYHRLRRACGERWVVMTQVSMAALVDTELKPEHPDYWEARKLFAGRICDYVVCDPRKLQPLLVIELDDKMHDFNRDRKRDAFMAQTGMPTLRFWSKNKPTDEELRTLILKKLQLV